MEYQNMINDKYIKILTTKKTITWPKTIKWTHTYFFRLYSLQKIE